MDDDPIKGAYEGGLHRPKLATKDGENVPPPSSPFALQPARLLAQGDIPHRQWLYGNQLIRSFVTLLVAPGGTGKSSLLLAMCMALASGRSLLGPRLHQRCRVALLNLEDPQDEIDRRVTALSMHYGITTADIDGYFFNSPAEQRVTIAANMKDGFEVWHPHEAQIIQAVKDHKIDVLAVDPFAESHTLEENSNPQMIAAAAAWRRVARHGDCSVVLAHHVRKGPVDSIEAARGAKALTDSARIGLLLSSMTEKDAEDLGVPLDERLRYIRLDDAKANMAQRATKASWFQLSSVTLDNANATYPHGDQVGVVEAWQPTTMWEKVPPTDGNMVLDRIAAGLPEGSRYTDSRKHPAKRWAGWLLVEICDLNETQAASVLKTWIKNGVLVVEDYHDPQQRKKVSGLIVNETKRPSASL